VAKIGPILGKRKTIYNPKNINRQSEDRLSSKKIPGQKEDIRSAKLFKRSKRFEGTKGTAAASRQDTAGGYSQPGPKKRNTARLATPIIVPVSKFAGYLLLF